MPLVQLILMLGLLSLVIPWGERLSRQKMATLFYAHSGSRPHVYLLGDSSAGNMWVHRYVYSICGILESEIYESLLQRTVSQHPPWAFHPLEGHKVTFPYCLSFSLLRQS